LACSSEDKIGGPIDTLKLGIVEGASEHDEIVLVNTCYESPIHPDPHGTWTQQLAFRQFGKLKRKRKAKHT
jgi:hypothetical protein